MSSDAKIWLSDEERVLVTRTDWILTKHRVIDKVYGLMGGLHQRASAILDGSALLNGRYPFASAKISRGEHYQGLPYVILDYPAVFSKTDIFALRSLFWWGHFFSVTLQLSGGYLAAARSPLLQKQEWLSAQGYAICTGDDPWQHHFGEDNYQPVQALPAAAYAAIIQRKSFVKIAKTFPLDGDWEIIAALMADTVAELAGLPGG